MAQGRHSYVRFYPSDWIAGTARLPRIHKSVYFDVCCYIWDTGKPVPPMEARLMFSDVADAEQVISDLIEVGKLTRLDDGSLSNDRALIEGEKAFSAWQAMSEAGKARHNGAGSEAGKGASKVAASDDEEGAEEEPRTKNHISPNGEDKARAKKRALGVRDRPDDVQEDVWRDFIEHRRAKKAPLTPTAWTRIANEAAKAGWDINDALTEAMTRGWQGFKADWVKGKGDGTGGKPSGWLDRS